MDSVDATPLELEYDWPLRVQVEFVVTKKEVSR